MQNSGFFNSVNGDRKYKAEFFAEYFASFIGNGVFPNPSTGLQIMANNDMSVTVKAGKGWINGYYYINNDDLILDTDVADGVLSRIDRIVLQYNTADRTIVAKVKKGAFASNPTAPELQRDADAYELGIADIYIAAGATQITQADITDLRLNSSLCGMVHGTVQQVDTTTLFNQYQTWLNQKKSQYDADMVSWTAQKKTDFNTWYNNITSASQTEIDNMEAQFQQDWNNWFATVQSALDGDTAGNLFNLINNLAGTGRTTETVKKNADDIAVLEVECNNLNTGVGNLNTNVLQARNEIMDIKLKLKEQSAIEFINKTGVGFYDTFEDNSNIDTANTTATYSSANKNVEFTGQQTLKMKDEAFDTFNNLELSLYPDKINKATIKGTVNNSTTVITGATDKPLTAGDKLFMDSVLNQVISASGNFTTYTVTDATVVASAFSTSGNGGRKLVRLSNGWLVAGALDTTAQYIRIYIDKVDGNGFRYYGYEPTSSPTDFSLQCKGDIVYILIVNIGNRALNVRQFKVLSNYPPGSLVNQSNQTFYTIDTNQSALGTCSLAINEAGTELHACWSSRNSTYSNSFNIRYCKGTINTDGSVIWSTIKQLTVANTAGRDNLNPSIVVNKNNYAVILWEQCKNDGSNYEIGCYYQTSPNIDDWNTVDIYSNSTYSQSFPCAIFVPQSINGLTNGRIWVIWISGDSSDSSAIGVSYSDDNGATWSSRTKLSGSTFYAPTIAFNTDNNGFILCHDNNLNIYRSTWNISTGWTGVVSIISGSGKQYPGAIGEIFNFTLPLFIYMDGQTGQIGVKFRGTWTVGEGYTLTMQNPTTLVDGQQVPIVDFEVKQNNSNLELDTIDSEKFVFKGSNLNTETANIKVLGKDNKINAIAYAVA